MSSTMNVSVRTTGLDSAWRSLKLQNLRHQWIEEEANSWKCTHKSHAYADNWPKLLNDIDQYEMTSPQLSQHGKNGTGRTDEDRYDLSKMVSTAVSQIPLFTAHLHHCARATGKSEKLGRLAKETGEAMNQFLKNPMRQDGETDQMQTWGNTCGRTVGGSGRVAQQGKESSGTGHDDADGNTFYQPPPYFHPFDIDRTHLFDPSETRNGSHPPTNSYALGTPHWSLPDNSLISTRFNNCPSEPVDVVRRPSDRPSCETWLTKETFLLDLWPAPIQYPQIRCELKQGTVPLGDAAREASE